MQIAWTFLLSQAAANEGVTAEVAASVPQQVLNFVPEGEDPATASLELVEELQEMESVPV